jgi:hypothetical protein
MVKVFCPSCDGSKGGFAVVCSADGCRTGMRACGFCKGEGQVSSEAAELWREGRAMRDARVKEGRSLFQEAKRRGVSPVDLAILSSGGRASVMFLTRLIHQRARKGMRRITMARFMLAAGNAGMGAGT